MEQPKTVFKQDLCDSKWRKKSLVCHKGTLQFTSDNVTDFRLYRAWCQGCDRTIVLDKKAFQKHFKSFVKSINKELGITEEVYNEGSNQNQATLRLKRLREHHSGEL